MASSNVLGPWTAPPLNMLAPTNCTLGTDWVAKLLSLGSSPNKEERLEPLGPGMRYLESAIPDGWRAQPSDSDLAAWYVDLHSANSSDGVVHALLTKMVRNALFDCGDDICKKLHWERDGDTYGVGMEISYFIVAVMSVIWFIANLIGDLPIMEDHRVRKTVGSRILRGFQETSNDFLDAALVFAAALLGAGITRFAKPMHDETLSYSAYGLLGSVFMSTFGIFPALLLQTVTDRVRRHWLRLFLWLVVIISCVILDIFYHIVYSRDEWFSGVEWKDRVGYHWQAHAVEVIWLRHCEGNGTRHHLKLILTFGHAWLAINLIWWFWYFATSVFPQQWIDRCRVGRWYHLFKRAQSILLLLDGFICIVAMFLLLISFRLHTERFMGMNEEARHDEYWTFGQVLALASWAPTIVQFFSITFFGKKGLSARFSWRYEVVETERPITPSRQKESDRRLPSP